MLAAFELNQRERKPGVPRAKAYRFEPGWARLILLGWPVADVRFDRIS